MDNALPSAPADRVSRRREQNRLAIIAATQHLLAERGLDISARDVAERADLALKTLYNHFPTKQDMVDAAVLAAAQEFEDYLKSRTACIEDPKVRAAMRMRLHGRMVDTHPTLARVLVNAPALPATLQNAMSAEAETLLQVVANEVRLSSTNHRMLLLVAFASNSRLTAARIADPSLGPEAADELAVWLITAFGYNHGEASDIVALPLPPWPVETIAT